MQGLGRLVETQTQDGLRLHGFWQQGKPADTAESPLNSRPVAWIVVHGVAGNFYNSSMLASVAENLLQLGHDTFRINTRGRDPIAYFATNGGNSRVGAAYEMIEDSQLDLESWVQFIQNQGYRRIGLIGHSLGAVKAAIYTCNANSTNAIDSLVCISPPRLASRILSSDSKYATGYAEDLKLAQEHVVQGQPESLLAVRYPQPMMISAATFLDKYGQEDQHDYVQLATRIAIPCLWCFGDQEVRGQRASFRDCDNSLLAAIDGKTNHTVAVVPKADHGYTHAREVLSAVIRRWISEKI